MNPAASPHERSTPAPRATHRRLIRAAIDAQSRLSARLDALLLGPEHAVDPFSEFARELVMPFLSPGKKIYDVGGGRNPFLPADEKARLGLRVCGLDLDPAALAQAPPGAYDQTLHVDLCTLKGPADGDFAICRTVLEHVRDPGAALQGIASLLRPGGLAAIFVPCRTAIFARLNLLLPEGPKRRLLTLLRPEDDGLNGFPAYYIACTRREMRAAATHAGFLVAAERTYFISTYFYFLAPLHALWRSWAALDRALRGEDAAEYLAFLLERPSLQTPAAPCG